MSLKSNLRVFVGIPQLSHSDHYKNYLPSVLDHLKKQETSVELMEPYITPPFSGRFHIGQKDRLEAIVDRMNNVVDAFMKTDATHLFVNDGDVEVPPETIDTLIRHNVDAASGVYPFHNFESCHAMCFGRMQVDNPCGGLIPRDWDYMKGMVFGDDERWSGGTGCVLIKRRVFKQYHHNISPIRFSRNGGCGLDILWWKRIQGVGFSIRIDARIVAGHLPKYKLSKIDEWLN